MSELAKFIEHTILKPDTTAADVKRISEEALQYNFAAVCIPPVYVRDARRVLGERSKVDLATVVGFPMGYSAISAKSDEIRRAMDEGANHIDAVINIAAVKSGMWNHVERDIDGLNLATQSRGGALKLILECGFLTEAELGKICQICLACGVPWLKTGTGFHGHNATVEMIATLKKLGGDKFKLKAAGGIRTARLAQALVDAGAERIGASASIDIIQGL